MRHKKQSLLQFFTFALMKSVTFSDHSVMNEMRLSYVASSAIASPVDDWDHKSEGKTADAGCV